jgi:hypothetical protein
MSADETPRTPDTAAAKKSPARKPAPRRAAAKRPSPKKSAPTRPRKPAAMSAPQGLLDQLAARVNELGDVLASLTGEGARATRQTYDQAAKAARQATRKLSSEWQKMDTRKKAQIAAGVLAAVAAAIATPLALARRKKKRR